ncbi:MAG: hypothetical protein EXR72_23690 [Myxococcales bacterium]|nr:hypothetical protein [Myxococcales bacterium]
MALRTLTLLVAALVAGCGNSGGRAKPPAEIPDLVVVVTADLATTPSDFSLTDFSVPVNSSTDMAQMTCGKATYQGKQSPAALLVVLDRSDSMADNNKWVFASQAIVQALDSDVFDTMYVGLYAAPSGNVNGPQCIFNLPVACQAPPFPQIDLKLSGLLKSGDNMGVRHDVKAWLGNNAPGGGGLGDASPLYNAIQAALLSLQGFKLPGGKRMLFVVTDGTISCNQLSKPARPGFPDCNGCTVDWEHPNNIVALLQAANKDPQNPVETFVVGVPGADTYDPKGCDFPPYHMRAALSALAAAGSPANIPANCTGKTFAQNSPDPQVSCHFDLTQNNFKPQALADAITAVRGKVLGCTFELPQVDGGVVDKDLVNVKHTIGGVTVDLKRRMDPKNACLMPGCWDYSKDGKVELIGKACTDIQAANNPKVEITLGCPTIIG